MDTLDAPAQATPHTQDARLTQSKAATKVQPELVFVYGTLKAGCNNNRYLEGCTLVGEGRVYGYALMNMAFVPGGTCFPGAYPQHLIAPEYLQVEQAIPRYVQGEVWRLPAEHQDARRILQRLDGLEGRGHMYERVIVNAAMGDTGDELLEVMMYYVLPSYVDDRFRDNWLRETGFGTSWSKLTGRVE